MKLRHVVLFGFAETVKPETVAEIVRRFGALKTLVPGIEAFECGENASPEGLNHGHTHAFLLTFPDAQARDAYLVHPDHVAFADQLLRRRTGDGQTKRGAEIGVRVGQ